MSDTTIEPMPDDVRSILVSMGMNDRDVELCGVLGQKVRDFIFDELDPDDTGVSLIDMAIAAVACKMTAAWLENVARKESGL